MQPLRFGVLGCANIARRYAIASIKKIGKLVAVASRDINKAKEWAKEYGCDAESYESLLARKDIDAVYIPLPISLHKEWAIKTANARKHVLCEKALAGSYNNVKNILDAVKNNNVLLFENYMVEYHPQHSKVISLIKDGEIGELRLFSSRKCFPPIKEDSILYKKDLAGGALNDSGGYIVFMSRKIFSEEPEAVTCKLFNDKHEVDTEGYFILEFKNGKTAFGFFGFKDFYQNNYDILGSIGKISVGRAYSIPGDLKPEVTLYRQDFQKNIDIDCANHFDLSFKDFADKVATKAETEYGKILSQARVMECLRISAREGRRVLISELD